MTQLILALVLILVGIIWSSTGKPEPGYFSWRTRDLVGMLLAFIGLFSIILQTIAWIINNLSITLS